MARRVRGQLLDALLESVPEACLGVDRSGRVRFVNQRALALLGGISSVDWVDQPIWELIEVSDFLKLLVQTVKSSHDQPQEQVVVLPPQSLYLAQISPVHNEENRLQGWVAYLRDMTPVQQIEKGIDDVLRDIHQQLRTPLTTIKGYVETLLEGAYQSPEVTRRFLQVINEESNRLARLIVSLEQATNPTPPVAAREAAGLVPVVMDVETYAARLAVSRIIGRLPGGGVDAVIALFEVGGLTSTLQVLRNDDLVYERDQVFGGAQLTQMLVRQYGFTFDEAETKKRAGELPDDFGSVVLQPFVESLAQEIERALKFFFTSTPHHRVDYILLAGGTAGLPGLTEVVTRLTSFPCQVVNPFDGMDVGRMVREKRMLREAPSYLTACGLAMRRFLR